MPRYLVEVSYRERVYYSGSTEIEAESREEAEEIARDTCYAFCDSHDSELEDYDLDNIECISGDDPEEEEEVPKQLERNLPDWF